MKIFNLFVLYRSNIHFAEYVYHDIHIPNFVFNKYNISMTAISEVPSTIL